MKLRSLALVGLAAVLTLGFAPAASAAPVDEMQSRIDKVLEDFPGGVQISPNEVAWDDGATVLTLEDSTAVSAFSVGSCPAGSFCAYSYAGYVGSRLTFTSCTASNSVAPLGTVRSIANSRASGTVRGYNGTTVTVSVAANTGVNTTAAITRLGC
ncbi:peptidase inhibitor family I36 protein [Agromyces sp. NPDC058126]|uniref:peptidase inhibitor family I36 protein n=1 Tax=Agromyces sp. NPDC058126 TaxID=3346350 RepID=UPI0036D797BB